MEGEIKFFRKRFIGGFNRKDVVESFAEVTKERDAQIAAKEKVERDARALAAEIVSLKHKLAETEQKATEYQSQVIEAAKNTLADFEAAFEGIRARTEAAAEGVNTQLELARGNIAVLPITLKKAGEQFRELREILESGVDIPYGEDMPSGEDISEDTQRQEPDEEDIGTIITDYGKDLEELAQIVRGVNPDKQEETSEPAKQLYMQEPAQREDDSEPAE